MVNIIRLLQTLDQDGIPENGITITETAKINANPVAFTLPESEFEKSLVVVNLISDAGQDNVVTELISKVDAIENLNRSLSISFTINMTGRSATSNITNSACRDAISGGFEYSFSDTAISLKGSDQWYSGGFLCSLGDINNVMITPEQVTEEFGGDFPFNCKNYPTCTKDDFEREISGIDADGRKFTAKSSFNPFNLTVTYIKQVTITDEDGVEEKTVFEEKIHIEGKDKPIINMNGRRVTSVVTNSVCPDNPSSFEYFFTSSAMTLTGADGWSRECKLANPNTVNVTPTEVVNLYNGDFPFHCSDYPLCRVDEFKREFSGVDVDGRKFHSFSRFNRAKSKLTYTKVFYDELDDSYTSFIEVISIR